jgi:NADH dehydrogenase FAD-containing subunit
MLAGTAVGTVKSNSIIEPIRWYINRSGHTNASFVQASCENVNIEKKIVYATDIRGDKVEVDYDHLGIFLYICVVILYI